jgi:hypothetical protein
VASLPEGVTAALEAAFLEALDPPQPEAFRECTVLAAVSYTLLTFGHFRRFVMDRRPVGPPDRAPCDGPRYVLLRLTTVASQEDRIPALAELAARLKSSMLRRWPEIASVPTYPAFR